MVKLKFLGGCICTVIDDKGKPVHKKVLPGTTETVTEKERDKLPALQVMFEEIKDTKNGTAAATKEK